MNLEKKLEKIKKNAIKIITNTDENKKCNLGDSKFGGRPDLPADFNWYYYEDKSEDGYIEKYPLSFLAQINLREVKGLDKDNALPAKGILYFFYDLETMKWGFDPKDKGCARVYYYDGKLSDLVNTDYPANMKDECKLNETKIEFISKDEVPYYEEYSEMYDYNGWDEYDEVKFSMGFDDEEEEEEGISKLLGYANIIQNDMHVECKKVTRGIYCGEPHELEERLEKKMKKSSKDWQLLFQMDSLLYEDADLMFGDEGRLYFYIKKKDLDNKDFENCWMILQCS